MKIAIDIAPIDTRKIVRRIQQLQLAQQECRPIVGDAVMACDLVDQVYTKTMEHLGRDCSDIKGQEGVATAIWPTFKQWHQRGAAKRPIATDAKTVNKRNEMFPQGNRLSRTGY